MIGRIYKDYACGLAGDSSRKVKYLGMNFVQGHKVQSLYSGRALMWRRLCWLLVWLQLEQGMSGSESL